MMNEIPEINVQCILQHMSENRCDCYDIPEAYHNISPSRYRDGVLSDWLFCHHVRDIALLPGGVCPTRLVAQLITSTHNVPGELLVFTRCLVVGGISNLEDLELMTMDMYWMRRACYMGF